MAPLPFTFNAHGYAYQDSIRVLRLSFQAAEDALLDDLDRAKDEAMAWQQSLDMGGEWIGERDEDGHVLWDRQTLLDFRVEDSRQATDMLRKAFLIAIYHHWERSACTWTGLAKTDHAKLTKAVSALGYPLHPGLDTLRVMANTLKHDNDGWGGKCLAQRPDLFPYGFTPVPGKTRWSMVLTLHSRHIEEAFDAIARSGPTSGHISAATPGQTPGAASDPTSDFTSSTSPTPDEPVPDPRPLATPRPPLRRHD